MRMCLKVCPNDTSNQIEENNNTIEEFEENESIQEISECLILIEDFVRRTRNHRKDIENGEKKIEKKCQLCSELEINKEKEGKRNINKADLYIENAGMFSFLNKTSNMYSPTLF